MKSLGLLLLVVAVGALIRACDIGSQIPFDDEWHAISFSLDQGFSTLLASYSRVGANSVPQNLYLRLVALTVGLSEWTIVLPSLLASVVLLWSFGRYVAKRFGDDAALLATMLLALSPLLIFYARFARPYAPLLLFEFLALAHLADWLRTQERKHRRAAVIFAVLAIWVHASAAPAIAAIWCAGLVVQWRDAKRAGWQGLRPRDIVKAAGAILLLAGLPTLYWQLTVSNPDTNTLWRFSWQTLVAPVHLLFGTSLLPVLLLFAILALAGLGLAARHAPREMILFGAASVGPVIAVLVLHPAGAEIGAIAVRYTLPLFLLPALCIGIAGQALAEGMATAGRKRAAWVIVALGLPASMYLCGPLPRTFSGMNSFTKHPTFLLDPAAHDPDRVRPDPYIPGDTDGLPRTMLQPFYAWLAREPGAAPIIEYPFLLGRTYNVLYFPQQIHHRPVIAGYYQSAAQDQDLYGLAMGPRLPPEQAGRTHGYILDAMMIDHALGRADKARYAHFATVVDILDEVAVRRSGAHYLVLHGNIMYEFFLNGPKRIRSYFVQNILGPLSERYGKPIFENDFITVFRLTAPNPGR